MLAFRHVIGADAPTPTEDSSTFSGDASSDGVPHNEASDHGGNTGGDGPSGASSGKEEAEGDDKLPLRTCAAAAAELVTCVLRSGGWPGACSDARLRGCLARTGHVGPGERASLVAGRHGRAAVVHADVFESLALMMYGEWMEWGLGVLERSSSPRER
jgi:hypothetical protein